MPAMDIRVDPIPAIRANAIASRPKTATQRARHDVTLRLLAEIDRVRLFEDEVRRLAREGHFSEPRFDHLMALLSNNQR